MLPLYLRTKLLSRTSLVFLFYHLKNVLKFLYFFFILDSRPVWEFFINYICCFIFKKVEQCEWAGLSVGREDFIKLKLKTMQQLVFTVSAVNTYHRGHCRHASVGLKSLANMSSYRNTFVLLAGNNILCHKSRNSWKQSSSIARKFKSY